MAPLTQIKLYRGFTVINHLKNYILLK